MHQGWVSTWTHAVSPLLVLFYIWSMSILGYLRSNHISYKYSIQINLHEVCQLFLDRRMEARGGGRSATCWWQRPNGPHGTSMAWARHNLATTRLDTKLYSCWLLRASPVAELWADVDLMNRIITAGACRSLKERERVDLRRGVESYRLKNWVLKFQPCMERKKALKDILPFNYFVVGPSRDMKLMKYVRWKS